MSTCRDIFCRHFCHRHWSWNVDISWHLWYVGGCSAIGDKEGKRKPQDAYSVIPLLSFARFRARKSKDKSISCSSLSARFFFSRRLLCPWVHDPEPKSTQNYSNALLLVKSHQNHNAQDAAGERRCRRSQSPKAQKCIYIYIDQDCRNLVMDVGKEALYFIIFMALIFNFSYCHGKGDVLMYSSHIYVVKIYVWRILSVLLQGKKNKKAKLERGH